MSFTNLIKNTCKKLGENNKPTYVVMAIATVKGICRPAFTMMDKTENPETKKYTALREGLTEVIAIPAYWACGELASKLSKTIKDPDMAKRASKNLMFMGVCAAALFVIPATCSAVIKPIMDKMGLKPKEKSPQVNPPVNVPLQTINPISTNKYPTLRNFPTSRQYGMKVGGL